jgi:hypothetical protein
MLNFFDKKDYQVIKKIGGETMKEIDQHRKNNMLEKETSGLEEKDNESKIVDEVLLKEVQALKKHDEAKVLVTKAKNMIREVEDQTDACKLLLSDDLQAYEEAKQSLRTGGMDASEVLLNQLGYIEKDKKNYQKEEDLVFETKEDINTLVLHDVSSGKITGFLLSIGGGIMMFGVLMYYAMRRMEIRLDTKNIVSSETVHTIFGWFGTQIGRPYDAWNGGLLVGVVVLVIMVIIYLIRINIKGSKNLYFAAKQLKEAEIYTIHKENCKKEMDKVDAHIHDAIETLKTYQILLNEQKGKLERIFYFEGGQDVPNYHEKSLIEMKETEDLLDAITGFMATSMSEEGKLSGKSTLFLHRAKSRMQKMIERLY